MASYKETALVFKVDNSAVVGILHRPQLAPDTGIIMVAAGGPQYRAGVGRQLVTWSRWFCEKGIAVLRFDYRGMGDSGGAFKGYEDIETDLKAAVDQLLLQQPSINNVVLWGGCNAASSILMYAWQDTRVTQFIISNPFIRDERNQAKNLLKNHYAKKILDISFWRSIVSGQVNIVKTVKDFFGTIISRFRPAKKMSPSLYKDEVKPYFIDRMLAGLKGFHGKGLILSSAGIVGQEFEEQLNSSMAWKKAASRDNFSRITLSQAGHNFAEKSASDAVLTTSFEWISENRS